MSNNVKVLLNGIASGDERAFRDLYYLYYEKLFSFARWYVNSAEVAEDVVSDVFFNLWKGRTTIADITYFETYIYAAVKNGCFNILKSSYHQRVSLIVDELSMEAYIEPDSPDTKAMYNQLSDAVTAAINHLPERCRLIFKLVKEDNLKYKEIAEILDISPRTVETQVAIALKKIEQELLPFLE
jgi:RNA polymerase sigma-70 factor (family 1)